MNGDEEKAHWFKLGWDACIKEVVLQNEHGQLDRFLKEQQRHLEEQG